MNDVELFAVFDQAAMRFLDPFPGVTVEFAIRGFKEACQQEAHQFAKFPEDYVLFHVGAFNAETGVVIPKTANKVAMASSFVHGAQIDINDQLRGSA